MPRTSTRRLATTGALVAGMIGAGVAFAAWSTTGTGPSEARALSAVNVTVTSRTATADLYPGFADGDVLFTVANTNPYLVQLTAASFGAVVSSDPTACPPSSVTVDATKARLALAVPAAGSADLTIADVVNMAAGAPDGCQAKAFTITLTLTGSQVRAGRA